MQNNLGVTQCESRTGLRLRSVHKSAAICGSSIKMTTTSIHVYQKVSVVAANTKPNVLNGASLMKITESGVGLHPDNGKRLGLNVES